MNLAWHLTTDLQRPREAIELLWTFDTERVRRVSGYWQRMFEASMMLGEHEQGLEVALRGREELPDPGVV